MQPTTHTIDRRSTFDVVAMQKIKALTTKNSSSKAAIGSPSAKHGVGTIVEEDDRRKNNQIRILS